MGWPTERSFFRAARRLALAGAALCASFAAPGPARADLGDDAARLVRIWSLGGARVARLPALFAEHGRSRLVAVAPTPAASGAPDACLTVAFLAPRVVEFTLDPDLVAAGEPALAELLLRIHGQDAEDDRHPHSVAGAAAITRCGAERAQLHHVLLDVVSSRAAFEVVVATSSAPPERLEVVFPERVFGPVAPRGDPGRPVEPGALPERIARADRRARLEGAQRVVQVDVRASAAGTGQMSVKLTEGCHRLDVMAEIPAVVPRRATDVDAEARELDSGRMFDRDRSDAPDARLDFCVGETGVVEVPFLGASGAVRVVVSDAWWPLPAFVPAQFGARARGGFAAALQRRRAPAPRAQTLAEAVGVQGETLVPVTVEPGRCYFAALALIRGDARTLRIAAEVGDRAARDDAPERGESAGVAFCSEAEDTAALRVTVRGGSPWWALVLWPMD